MKRLARSLSTCSFACSVVLAILSAGLLAGCGGDAPAPEAQAGPPPQPNVITLTDAQMSNVDIDTVTVRRQAVTRELSLPARVRPAVDGESYVTSLVEGRVERLTATVGDRVRRGQVVAEVTAPEMSSAVAELREARDELDRQQRLSERGVAITRTVRAAERSWQAARQRMRSLGVSAERIERVATGEEDLDTLPLTAPMAGVVVDRMAALGAPVAPGDRLFRIVDLQPIRVVADVFERNLGAVGVGQAVRITTTAVPGRVYEGTVAALAPQIDQERRAAQVVTILDNGDESLRPGMFATTRVQITGDPQPAVPASVLLTDAAGAFVLVMEGPRTFRRIYVEASADAGGVVAVPDVPVGAVVVSNDAYRIVSQMNQQAS